MTGQVAALLLGLFGSPMGPGISLSGAVARPDAPAQVPLWSEYSAGATWRDSTWNGRLEATRVNRWDLEDFQAGLQVGFRLGRTWNGEVAGSLGARERFLPSWSAGTSLAKTLSPGWVATLGGKWARYGDWEVRSGRLLLERYFRAWRLGIQAGTAWPGELDPRMEARGSVGWDWSDLGGIALDATHAREAEKSGTGLLSDRTSQSLTLSVRQEVRQRATLRPSISWTRLEGVHQRLEARLGIECGLGH